VSNYNTYNYTRKAIEYRKGMKMNHLLYFLFKI